MVLDSWGGRHTVLPVQIFKQSTEGPKPGEKDLAGYLLSLLQHLGNMFYQWV